MRQDRDTITMTTTCEVTRICCCVCVHMFSSNVRRMHTHTVFGLLHSRVSALRAHTAHKGNGTAQQQHRSSRYAYTYYVCVSVLHDHRTAPEEVRCTRHARCSRSDRNDATSDCRRSCGSNIGNHPRHTSCCRIDLSHFYSVGRCATTRHRTGRRSW